MVAEVSKIKIKTYMNIKYILYLAGDVQIDNDLMDDTNVNLI